MLIQAAWAAIRVRGRLAARYSRLVRRFGGDKNPGAKKKAITAIAHTLLKIAARIGEWSLARRAVASQTWNESWNGWPRNSSAISASRTIGCAICAGHAIGARRHASRNVLPEVS